MGGLMINLNDPESLLRASQFCIGLGSAALLSYAARMFPNLIYVPVIAGGSFLLWYWFKNSQINRTFADLISRIQDQQAYAEMLLQKEQWTAYLFGMLVTVGLGVAIALLNPFFFSNIPARYVVPAIKFAGLAGLAIAWAIVSLFLFKLWHHVPADKAGSYPFLFLVESMLFVIAGIFTYGL